MKTTSWTLVLLTFLSLVAGPLRADLSPAADTGAGTETTWSRFMAQARSAPASPVVTNAVRYRTGRPEKQVELKKLELEAIGGIRLLTHANIPLKVLMACIARTRDEVQAMIQVVKQVNEEEKLPQDERIKLHLVCDDEKNFRLLDVSQEDFDRYLEVDRYFHTSNSDIWMQDWGEIAMVDAPGQKKQQLFIFDTNRARASLAELPGTLARMWSGYYFQKPTPSRYSSGDYGGNIEVTPDNVLVIGNTASQELLDILAKGYQGRTALLDTNWLMVGHVDEYVTTVPTPAAPRGYVIVKADPELGLKRIAGLSREQLDLEMAEMVRTLHRADAVRDNAGAFDTEHNSSQRVFATLYAYHAHANGYALDPAKVTPGGRDITDTVKRLIADNKAIKATIDAQIGLLQQTISKSTGDDQTAFTVLALPALFEPFNGSGKTVAMLPGAANLLVLRNHVVLPDPFLPSLRSDIEQGFAKLGLKPHLIPDATYHYFQGQLHCGTNVLRHPNRWLKDPARRPERVQRFHELTH